MKTIDNIEDLEALYDAAVPNSLKKVVTRITPHYATWINASKFCVLTTVGPEGTDGSPRGDVGPVVRIVDDKTLMIPDWRGNNRIDSLRNIVRDGRVSLMFMAKGSNSVVRINGNAVLANDPDVTVGFEQGGKHPKSVIVFTVGEAYFQCAKALMRSGLWDGDAVEGLPSAGDFIKEQIAEFDGKAYDENYAEYAKGKMW
ncbi:hypothetical protein GQR58_029946 [Nymphon striatum]|nr:hypothetical protein GQR58_029946 [Nymphon striatum]